MDIPEKVEPLAGCSHEDTCLKFYEEEEEEMHISTSVVMSIIVDGDDEEEKIPSKLEPTAPAGDRKEGPVGAGAPYAVWAMNPEDHGVSIPDLWRHQQEELGAQGPCSEEGPQLWCPTMPPQMQMQELESIFQYKPYPHKLEWLELARLVGVTEAQVQTWFKNRRAKWRRHQRALTLRNTHAAAPGLPVSTALNGHNNGVPVPEWKWVSLVPPPAMPPMPPLPSAHAPWYHAPLPPFDQASLGLAWAPIYYTHFVVPNF